MAFGALKGTLTGDGTSITASNALTGSVAVVVGDLVIVDISEQSLVTATGVTDNLGNTYQPQNAGTLSSSASGRMFYAYVTAAGTLTTVTVAATASAHDYSGSVAVFEGPFDSVQLLDASPANNTDASSPFTCPASGTLTMQPELVVGWGSCVLANTTVI